MDASSSDSASVECLYLRRRFECTPELESWPKAELGVIQLLIIVNDEYVIASRAQLNKVDFGIFPGVLQTYDEMNGAMAQAIIKEKINALTLSRTKSE